MHIITNNMFKNVDAKKKIKNVNGTCSVQSLVRQRVESILMN